MFSRKSVFILLTLFFMPAIFFAQESTIRDAVNRWYESPDEIPHDVPGYVFFTGSASERKTREEAISFARKDLQITFAKFIHSEASGSTEFEELLEGSDDFATELESWAKMHSKSMERFFANTSGIQFSAPRTYQIEDKLWECDILGWMGLDDIEKSRREIADEDAARSVYNYFERASTMWGFEEINPEEESYLRWVENKCVRIVIPDDDSDGWTDALESFVEKMFRTPLYMLCTFEETNHLVVYDRGAYLKNLMDNELGKQLGVKFSQNGNTLSLDSECNLSEFKKSISSMKNGGSIDVFLCEALPSEMGANGFDSVGSVKLFRNVAEESGFSIKTKKDKFGSMDDAVSFAQKSQSNSRYVVFIEVCIDYKKGVRSAPSKLSASLSISCYDTFIKKPCGIITIDSGKKNLRSGGNTSEQIQSEAKKILQDLFEKSGGIKSRLNNLLSIL